MPPKAMGPINKQEKRKSNLHIKEDFCEKLVSMNLGLVRTARCPNPGCAAAEFQSYVLPL